MEQKWVREDKIKRTMRGKETKKKAWRHIKKVLMRMKI